jgi:hypothetical protein
MKIFTGILVLVTIVCVSNTFSLTVITNQMEEKSLIINKEQNSSQWIYSSFVNDTSTSLIDEFTWAIMKYDCNWPSDNFGLAEMPTPDPGTILCPADMMSPEACRLAVSVYDTDKMRSLEALETYALNNMRLPFYASHPLFTIVFSNIAATTHLVPVFGIQKNSVDEMKLLGDIVPKATFVGDCYSQAVLNTAVLRLCGFSAEDVFTVLIPMHAVTIVQIGERWYVFDSVAGQESGKAIYDSYILPPFMQTIYALENDKYFINFGRGKSDVKPYLDTLFSNIDSHILSGLLAKILSLFSNATLGSQKIGIDDFVEQAVPCPEILTVAIPYTVDDVSGSTIEEKADALASLIQVFVSSNTGGDNPNQYDRSLYSHGVLSVKYPQAYVNAAKYGSWTSWFARVFDVQTPNQDIQRVINGINFCIKNRKEDTGPLVYFSDFLYRIREGSSIDKAIVAYGTLRNMKKEDNYWCPQELYVMVSENDDGYLAVNSTMGWRYLDFSNSGIILVDSPDNIKLTFNERECIYSKVS